MIRFLLRVAGLLLLAVAFALVVVDGTRSIAAGSAMLTSLGDAAAKLFPAEFPLLKPAVESRFPAWIWDPVTVDALKLPSWLACAAVGLIFMRLARKPRPKIGYSSRD